MIILRSILAVADTTVARKAAFIGVLKARGKSVAQVGNIIRVNIKEAAPNAAVKKGQVVKAVIVRQKFPLRRPDGTYVRFDTNAIVIVDDAGNPKGTRVFGPVARELRNLDYMKIISLAPEVV